MAEVPYLAFDTSGAVGSVAVGVGSRVLANRSLEERHEHAARLVPAIDRALADCGIDRSELGGIVVGEGPGSFTGVRVAAATAKGLAHALDLPLWAFPSLAAAALAEDVGPIRYALFDARSDRVYGACYGVGSSAVQDLVDPHGGTLRDTLGGDVPGGAVFVGDGSLRHRAAIVGAGFAVGPGPSRTLAEGLLRLLGLRAGVPPVADLAAWEPRYVRGASAERGWIP
ncbi:MAG: tRNA (adenosine(37)-N6)-threonylcarbamoyltransferase complex dimerization subunit type 1 TsaB [Gemmatimonadetes bacterium]|nr:tRNA (adenosine(37)-N6)-threonylcarbamoyltransferase complex dimerization subunit type 1 TsaB [Gemmatimonadota bacterium]